MPGTPPGAICAGFIIPPPPPGGIPKLGIICGFIIIIDMKFGMNGGGGGIGGAGTPTPTGFPIPNGAMGSPPTTGIPGMPCDVIGFGICCILGMAAMGFGGICCIPGMGPMGGGAGTLGGMDPMHGGGTLLTVSWQVVWLSLDWAH